MKKIFISYSWKHDTVNAEKVYAAVTSFPGKFNVWMDKESLEGGLEWRPAIIKAIRQAKYFIAILSPGSVKKIGVTNAELYEAIDVLKQYPPNKIYLVPTRIKNCTSPFEQLAKLNYVDLFPDWDQGMEKLIKTLDKTINFKSPSRSSKQKPAKTLKRIPDKIGLVDLDIKISNLPKVVSQLNRIQKYFLFTIPDMKPIRNKTEIIDDVKNFNVSKVSKSYIKNNLHLDTDFIACFIQYPLAFEEDHKLLYNYFSGPSDYDERFMFISSDQLEQFSKNAGRKFEEGLIYMLVGQLIYYFTKTEFHDQIRGCIMDFCETRSDIVRGFKKRKLCASCNKNFPEGELKEAINTLLNWKYV